MEDSGGPPKRGSTTGRIVGSRPIVRLINAVRPGNAANASRPDTTAIGAPRLTADAREAFRLSRLALAGQTPPPFLSTFNGTFLFYVGRREKASRSLITLTFLLMWAWLFGVCKRAPGYVGPRLCCGPSALGTAQ